jgi:hypothetical protein
MEFEIAPAPGMTVASVAPSKSRACAIVIIFGEGRTFSSKLLSDGLVIF